MTRALPVFLLLGLTHGLVVGVGCGSLGTHAACDLSAAYSVTIDIVDADGAPIGADTVTYTLDGGSEQNATCVDDECTSWVAGVEEVGQFHIVAGLCGGFTEVEVEVEPGECHVVSETVTLELDPAACDTTD